MITPNFLLGYQEHLLSSASRLAHKSSSKSAKRDRALCLEARSSDLERARARLVSPAGNRIK